MNIIAIVDSADQRTTVYARTIKGWTLYLKLFYHMLEVSVLNSYVIFCSLQEDNNAPVMIHFGKEVIQVDGGAVGLTERPSAL